jgi:hypothetical protein
VNRLTRLLSIAAGLVAAALISGCSNDLTAPSAPAFAEARTEPLNTLTLCRPLPYAEAAAWIGPKGGILRAGKHVLKVPAGALNVPVYITMEVPSTSINRVALGPSGLTFNKKYPAHLVMSYANCSVEADAQQQIVQVNQQLNILETAPSGTDPWTETVDGRLSHFSDYALSTYAVVY